MKIFSDDLARDGAQKPMELSVRDRINVVQRVRTGAAGSLDLSRRPWGSG